MLAPVPEYCPPEYLDQVFTLSRAALCSEHHQLPGPAALHRSRNIDEIADQLPERILVEHHVRRRSKHRAYSSP
jgi:hypothetical protein